jgi:hypothetical protein
VLDIITQLQCQFFAPNSLIKSESFLIRKLIDAFSEEQLIPQFQEGFHIEQQPTPPTANRRRRLIMTREDYGLFLLFGDDRVYLFRNLVKGNDIDDSAGFTTTAVTIYKKLFDVIPMRGTRLSYIIKGLFGAMKEEKLVEVNRNLLNLPPFYSEVNPPHEWSTQNSARVPLEINKKEELVNVITQINRVTGQLASADGHSSFDRIQIVHDINTHQNTVEQRFSIDDIKPFLDMAIGLSNGLIDKIEEILI